MKKIKIFLVFAALSFPAAADDSHAIFGSRINQFGLYGGHAVRSSDPEHYNAFIMMQYSQPTKILRLDGRLNVQMGYVNSETHPWVIGGISLDAALLSFRSFYAGVGMGVFMRNRETPRQDSTLTFGERAFVGRNIGDRVNLEFFFQHFSNGNLSEKNYGYNFLGMSVNLNF